MTAQLLSQTCETCHLGTRRLPDSSLQQLLLQVPQWQLVPELGVNMLTREYTFKNFKQALDFTNKVAKLAEAEFHHPAVLLQWGKVKVSWWTHAIDGLHNNDFICAAKTDQLF
jgi:4a-hydroxytetrahydrobiopterin dehydratase